MLVVIVLFWVFFVLAVIGHLPNGPVPYAGLFLCLAVLMSYFAGHGLHVP